MRQPGFGRPAFGAVQGQNAPLPPSDRAVRYLTLSQFSGGTPWSVTLSHDRNTDVLVWVTRGQGVVTINGIRRGVGPHNALFMPARTLISLDLGPQTLAQVVLSRPGICSFFPQNPMHLRSRDSLVQAELTGEMDSLQREQNRDRSMTEEALVAHLGLIGVWLNRQDQDGDSDSPPMNAARRLVRQFAKKVVAEFREPKKMADFAADLNVTPTHLARTCRECCGKTASDILTERRVHAARLDLAIPGRAIKDVSANLGFQSAAYFTRFILQHTGMTPTALRETGTAGHV